MLGTRRAFQTAFLRASVAEQEKAGGAPGEFVAAAARKTIVRWALAFGIVALATGLNFFVQDATVRRIPFLPYFPALVAVGLYAGLWPVVAAMVASSVLVWHFWLTPGGLLAFPNRPDWLALMLFWIAAGVVIGISVRARHLIAALRESRGELERIRTRLDAAHAATGMVEWHWDLDTGHVALSASARKVFGTDSSEIGSGLPLLHPDDRDRIQEAVARGVGDGTGYAFTGRLIRPDNHEHRWIETRAVVHRDVRGKPSHVTGVTLDITEKHLAQEATRASEEQLRLALEGVQIGMWSSDLHEGITRNSDILRALFGLDESQRVLPNDAWIGLVHPEDRDALLAAWNEAYQRVSPYSAEYRICRPDGNVRWIYTRGRFFADDAGGPPRRVAGISMDITDRKEAEFARAQAESMLQRTEQEFAGVVDLAPVGLIVARDRACHDIVSNAYAERLFGVPAGANLSVHSADQRMLRYDFRRNGEPLPAEELPLRKAARTGLSVRDELLQVTRPDGARLEILVSAEPLLDAEGVPRGAVGTVQDLTALRRMEAALRRSEERFRVAQESSLVAFAILKAVRHPDGSIVDFEFEYANEAAAVIARRPLSGILGRRLRDVLPNMDRRGAPFEAIAHVIESGISRTTHLTYDADGIAGTFLAAISPLGDGSAAISFMDVTERQALIDELRATEASLRDADRQKDEFLATLAHELRNPMAPIRYAAAIIRPDAPASSLEQARQVIERQAAQMSRLLEDLLDMSRVTRNVVELKREVLDLRNVVEEAVEIARPSAQAERHRISLSLPSDSLCVDGDAIRLGQVVGNLLQNAIKYTPAGGRIEVWLESLDEEALVVIRDNGVGLSQDMLPKVFKLFSQLHPSVGAAKGGLGIGLAVSKRLAELHGGTIEVRSEGLGHGATFTLRLPLESVSGQRSMFVEDSKVVTLFRSEPRVLVVDDNRDAADSLTLLLRSHGLNVHVAYGGREALALAENLRPDVMLLDIGLPDLSGHEVARDIRHRPWSKSLRLVAVTGWGQESDRAMTRAVGFDAHLVKPVNPDEVLAIISRSRPESLGTRQDG